jgi:hypothetical protein
MRVAKIQRQIHNEKHLNTYTMLTSAAAGRKVDYLVDLRSALPELRTVVVFTNERNEGCVDSRGRARCPPQWLGWALP